MTGFARLGGIALLLALASATVGWDLTGDATAETTSFVPADTADPTEALPAKALVVGVALLDPDDAARTPLVVVTDVHSGLYVLALDAATP